VAARQTPVALVFGPEDNGLGNEDLAACTQLIRIPSAPAYPSLNLSHAVMVCAYELFLAAGQYEAPAEVSPEAPAAMRENMFDKWRQALLVVGFMKEDKADHMMLALRRIFGWSPLTVKDVKVLVGIARQARWCGQELQKQRSAAPPRRD
jgi:tRNA/rRNA methyltransferase